MMHLIPLSRIKVPAELKVFGVAFSLFLSPRSAAASVASSPSKFLLVFAMLIAVVLAGIE
jgi:hypothetical protein